jgi:hypothetical protein
MQNQKSIKKDGGVAGLTILLSVVSVLFVMGLLVTIYTLMGTELATSDSLHVEDSGSDTSETLALATADASLTADSYRDGLCTILSVHNSTSGVLVPSSNYTQTNCKLKTTTAGLYNGSNVDVNYTYTYLRATEGVEVINDSVVAIGDTVDWFPLFIVITAMVVLILLTVIIITAIRGSGLMGGGEGSSPSSKRQGKIGTA